MTFTEIKEAASKIDYSNLKNKTTESEVAMMILDGRMTEEKFNRQINAERLSALMKFLDSPEYKPCRVMHSFKNLDSMNVFLVSHDCGNWWFDYATNEYRVYEYKKA